MPSLFQNLVLITGTYILHNPSESPFLLLKPFHWSMWLFCLILFVVLNLLENFKGLQKRISFFTSNFLIFVVIYSCNTKAITLAPLPSTLPFKTLDEFVAGFKGNLYKLAI